MRGGLSALIHGSEGSTALNEHDRSSVAALSPTVWAVQFVADDTVEKTEDALVTCHALAEHPSVRGIDLPGPKRQRLQLPPGRQAIGVLSRFERPFATRAIAELQLRSVTDRLQLFQLLQRRQFARRQLSQLFAVNPGLSQGPTFPLQEFDQLHDGLLLQLQMFSQAHGYLKLIGFGLSYRSFRVAAEGFSDTRHQTFIDGFRADLKGAAIDGLTQGCDFFHINIRCAFNIRNGADA